VLAVRFGVVGTDRGADALRCLEREGTIGREGCEGRWLVLGELRASAAGASSFSRLCVLNIRSDDADVHFLPRCDRIAICMTDSISMR
jgi:hypothetical protein